MKSGFRQFAGLAGLCAVILTGIVPAAAQSPLKELRARQGEEQSLASEADYTSEVCSTTIKARIDWSRSRNWPGNQSLADACDGALGAVETMCRSGKLDRVRERISSFSCSGDGSGPSLSGSTLSYGAAPGEDAFRETRAFLEDAL